MRERRCRRTVCLAIACLPGLAAARPTNDCSFVDLDSPDPSVRNTTTEALIAVDRLFAVRPSAIASLPNASPEAAARLTSILLRTVDWEPPLSADATVHAAFADYAALSADDRAGRILSMQGVGAEAALMHVLSADPSASVRWAAAAALRMGFRPPPDPGPDAKAVTPDDPATRVVAMVDATGGDSTYPHPADNAPLLALAAWALQWNDDAGGNGPSRGDGLMARSLAIETASPSAFRGQADFAFQWSIDRAVERRDYRAAVELSRELAARTSWSDDGVPDSVADLIAVQSEHGPFPGFADDLRLYGPYLIRPEMLFCLARAAERQGGGGRTASVALSAIALALDGTSVDDHVRVGRFLLQHEWPKAAAMELRAGLLLAGRDPPANLCLALHSLASQCDDDAAAGHYLEEAVRKSEDGALSRVDRYGQLVPWTADDQQAEIHWHYLRVAVNAGNRAASLEEAQKILALDEKGQVLGRDHDPGMAADIVPVLADAGLQTDADRCFKAAYTALAADVARRKSDPMPKNNLAWLCVRSDRKPDEAERLSAEAVALSPDDAACLDTRAEVLFHAGKSKEAVEMESRALAVKPDDVYMQRQLARFRKGS